MFNDKRKAIRIEKTLVAQYSQSLKEGAKWDSTTIVNISNEGILLRTNINFTEGEILNLRIKLPIDPFNYLEVKGNVVKSFLCKTHIHFIELTEENRKKINEYVSLIIKNDLSDKS